MGAAIQALGPLLKESESSLGSTYVIWTDTTTTP